MSTTSTTPPQEVKEFSSLGIKAAVKNFTGPKVDVSKLLNKKIKVIDFIIEPSNFPSKGNGMRTRVQFMEGDEYKIFFTSSIVIQDILKQTKKEDFPFNATLALNSGRLEFQ